LASERPVGAELLLVVVEAEAAAPFWLFVPSEPGEGLLVEPGVVAPAVPLPVELGVADGERDDDGEGDGDGLGHKLLYTNCSGAPLHVPADPASYVPLVYIQHVPEAYGELSGL
jgi:hypothetical protein